MATYEQILIARLIKGTVEDLKIALDWGIHSEDFSEPDCLLAFTHILGIWMDPATRGSKLGEIIFAKHYPTFDLVDDHTMTTEALCHLVRTHRLGKQAKEAALEMTAMDVTRPLDGIARLQAKLQQLQVLGVKTNDVLLSAVVDKLDAAYDLASSGKFVGVAKWPWQILNDLAGGVQDEDYVVYYGRPKSKKSFVLSYQAADTYEQQRRVMVYTKEMTPANISQRIVSCIGHLPYQEVRTGRLTTEQAKAYKAIFSYIKDNRRRSHGMHDLIIISGKDAPGQDTPAWLQAKVEKYKPDVLFIDGIYLMSDGNKRSSDWMRVTNISRAIRQMVLDTHVPVIATAQANRKAAGHQTAEFDEIAYADAIGQDATHCYRVVAERKEQTIALIAAGQREIELEGFRIHALPCINFGFKETMTLNDIEKAKGADADEHAPTQRMPKRPAGASPQKALEAAIKAVKQG